jgi:glycosyltransferase involved in cell wall biosynthesis
MPPKNSHAPAPSASGAKPLAGKTVAVVHAAWHSCGSYQVNVSQMAAYKALGARVISIAMQDTPGPPAPHGGRWRGYIEATRDLPADRRFFSSPPRSALASPGLLRDGWWRLIHGDQASWLIELAKRAPRPEGIETETLDLVHANHYFTLPFVEKLIAPRRVPVILETQDIQADQYVLRNKGGFFIPPRATRDDMLKVELEWMRRADLSVHLNEEEHLAFQRLLPEGRHALVYPAVAPVPRGPGGREIVIVASDNYGNFISLRWFLNEVLPLADGVPVAIYGNIDAGVRNRDRALYETHRDLFKGRVADIGAVYANAACVLLPTVEGHGLSIKAVEALSCGAPLIATPQAFRGMGVDARTLGNVTLAEAAPAFASAWRAAVERAQAGDAGPSRERSDTRRLYDEVFSFEAYQRALEKVAIPLLQDSRSRSTGVERE